MRSSSHKKCTGIIIFLLFLVSISGSGAVANTEAEDKVKRARHLFLSALKTEDRGNKEKLIKEFVSLKESAVEYIVSEIDWKDPEHLNFAEEIIPRLARVAERPFMFLLGDSSAFRVSVAIRFLGKIKSKRAVVPLILLLNDYRVQVRASSAYALGEIGDKSSAVYIRQALRDTVPAVRRNACISLGKLRSKVAIPELIKCLDDTAYSVAYAASYALISIGDPSITDTLLALLPTSKGAFRYHIIETLGGLRDEKSLPVLLPLLEHPSFIERGITCEALGNFRGNYRVANALKKLLNDPSPFVRMEATNALKSIRGY